jgi:hypothetical protein
LTKFSADFESKVFALALTDSAHGAAKIKPHIQEHLKRVGRNWVTSSEPLGTEIYHNYPVPVDEVSAGMLKTQN